MRHYEAGESDPAVCLEKFISLRNLNVSEEDFSKLLLKTYKKLSPFYKFDVETNDATNHLLGCVHAIVSTLVVVIIEKNQPKWFSCQVVKHCFEMVIVALVGMVYDSIVMVIVIFLKVKKHVSGCS